MFALLETYKCKTTIHQHFWKLNYITNSWLLWSHVSSSGPKLKYHIIFILENILLPTVPMGTVHSRHCTMWDPPVWLLVEETKFPLFQVWTVMENQINVWNQQINPLSCFMWIIKSNEKIHRSIQPFGSFIIPFNARGNCNF